MNQPGLFTAIEVAMNVCTGVGGVILGMGIMLLWVRLAKSTESAAEPAAEPAAPSPQAANNAARASMAVDQIRTLTQSVASDVGEHTALVGGFSEQLAELHQSPCNHGEIVNDIVGKMLDANTTLKWRLDDAERKIQTQAEELRVQHIDATTDSLTNLPNRRAFDAFLAEQVTRKAESGTQYSLLFFDLDNFKKLNDLHGHLAGDAVLQQVGKTLPQIVKKTDLACRYGGEEFAVVMPQTTCAEAQRMAERLRTSLDALRTPFEGRPLKITASVGVAEGAQGERGLQAMRRADEAVYASKEAGRNCCHYHDGLACFLVIDEAKAAAARQVASDASTVQVDLSASKGPTAALGLDAFLELLHRRIAERHRTGSLLAVAYLQLKNFDRITLKYGNAVGEHVINVIATFIRSGLRDMDILGKVADDALAIMLPGNSASAAHIVAERVRASVSQCALPLGDRSMRIDLVLGTTEAQPRDDAEAFVRRAKEEISAATELEVVLA